MPWLEKRGDKYRIKFRYGGRNLQVALETNDPYRAQRDLARLEEILLLLERGRLDFPADADVGRFLLTNRMVPGKPAAAASLTVGELCALYAEHFTKGAKEENTREVEAIHLSHVAPWSGRRRRSPPRHSKLTSTAGAGRSTTAGRSSRRR